MARSVSVIQNQIITAVTANAVLSNLNSTSQTAIWRLWSFIEAVNLNLEEQLWDSFKEDLEAIALAAASGNASWLQNEIKHFQFGDTVQLVDFVATYPIIDETKQIVTQCSITQSADRRVFCKVAKGLPNALLPLSTDELNALTSYVNQIKFAGTALTVLSLASDKLYVDADIYFDGQYIQSDVKAAVKAAILNYLSNLDFNGSVYLSQLETSILSVAGVKDVVLNLVKGRADVDPITSTGAVTITRNYSTEAGYIIPETTSGYTLDDSLTFIINS